MNWNTLPADVRQLAEEVLSDKQREVIDYELRGWSITDMARHCLVTHTAIKHRLHNAHKNLTKAGVTRDEFGRWTIERTEAA